MNVLTTLGSGLLEGLRMLWETLWALVLGFTLSGAVQAFVSRERMTRVLGGTDVATIGRATFFGMVSSSCSYAAAAMAKSLFSRGASLTASLVFMLASTNLVIELGIVLVLLLGWQFLAAELVGGVIMIALLAIASRWVLTKRVINGASARVLGSPEADDHEHHHGEAGPNPAPVRTLAGWADAAGYTIGDITMLRRELVIGFGVAGLLTVIVPDSVWSALFIPGHGAATSVENAIVGPLIAVISFVCSVGNVPLAAALWKGGISFGGVVSFIFADLITFPLLLVYRRYWGWSVSLRIAGLFWAVMALGGLAVEALASLLGLVPAARPAEVSTASVGWNPTSVLDVVALIVLAGLYGLHRRRATLGGARMHAVDPVCGMQVEMAHAPGRAGHGSETVYFCSEGCRDRYLARRAEVARPGAGVRSATLT